MKCRCVMTIGLILALPGVGGAQSMIESPRLRALQEQVEGKVPGAVEHFWVDVEKIGTPLIERVTENELHALVTFLWRGAPTTKHVFLVAKLGQFSGTQRRDNHLTRLANTSVWYASYWVRKDIRTIYRFGVNASLKEPANELTWAHEDGVIDDPLNLKRWSLWPPNAEERIQVSILEMPAASTDEWSQPRPGVPTGTVRELTFVSRTLKNERQVWIYTPPGYSASQNSYPVLVATDGENFNRQANAPTLLDNLIHAGRIPPLVAVLIGNAGRTGRFTDLNVSEPFLQFLTEEAIPWIRANYHVTHDPAGTAIAGFSLGGLSAAFAGLRRPDLFGNVLSISGSFWWKPRRDVEGEWLTRQFAERPKASLRFFLSVGLLEAGTPPGGGPDWMNNNWTPYPPSMLVVNRHIRDILRLKGYSVQYKEIAGAHDYLNVRVALPDGLIALFGGPRP